MLISTKNMPLHCNKMLLHGLCLARVLILATGILVAKFLTTWYGTRKSVLWRKNSAPYRLLAVATQLKSES